MHRRYDEMQVENGDNGCDPALRRPIPDLLCTHFPTAESGL